MRKRAGKVAFHGPTLLPLASLVPDTPPEIRLVNRTAMRASWNDPEDDRPSAARTARTISGHMSFCPLRWCLHRHGERSSYTVEHIQAADRLRLAFDGSRLGFSALKDWRPIQATQFRPSTGPGAAALKQTKAARDFAAAWGTLDQDERAMLVLVVLRNTTISKAAIMLEISGPIMTRRLVTALDRLCDHYDIRRTEHAA
jgi:hypothetical protein